MMKEEFTLHYNRTRREPNDNCAKRQQHFSPPPAPTAGELSPVMRTQLTIQTKQVAPAADTVIL